MGIFGKSTPHRKVQGSVPPDDLDPICPFCEEPVAGVYTREISMPFGKTWLFFCTKCSKVLGTSQRKTIPMG